MENPKEYHIDTFDKLCNTVTKENAQRLALDLANWLIFYSNAIEKIKEEHPKETKGKTNSKIAKASFIWVDDGHTDLLGVQVVNDTTGETTRKDFPNREICYKSNEPCKYDCRGLCRDSC
jgi:hypothetical protein